jgi:glycosyltransferase involved in cell wall biosynthesis
MRILLWYWGRRGAGGQLTLSLAEALRHQPGVKVALAISAQAELQAELQALGLCTDVVDTYVDAAGFLRGFFRLPALARRLRRQAQGFRADVVVSVMTHLWTPLVAPRLHAAGIPFVPFIHDALPHPGDPGWLWDWRLERELDAATAAIALSDSVATALRARRPHLPVHRLPLGAHLPAELLQAAPPSSSGMRFLLFGRMRAYKGLDLLRDAWPLLRARYPEATLRVVGEGDPEALAPGLGALPGVTLEPRWLTEAEIPPLIAAADVVVLPYREASQSGIVALAQALGVPVVATPIGGLAEQVRHGTDGVLATEVSPTALADAMARLCQPEELARLAEGARRAGESALDWDGTSRRLLDILARLDGRGPAADGDGTA